MMSSKESYADRRSDLLHYIEDQAESGVYQTRRQEVEVPDPLDEKKTRPLIVVEVARDQNGAILRQESGVLARYGIKTGNFTFTITYDPKVEAQIQDQQKLAQDINTSIAEAKKAQQRAITVAANGEADAAQAKWDQEKVNSKIQAEAEQEVRTAQKRKESAELHKAALVLEGQGEAEKKRLILSADGALAQKLEAYKDVQRMWADAFKGYQGQIVPSIVTGGGANRPKGGNNIM